MYDTIIIGAGPAGMTAALYAARSNLKVALIEGGLPGGQMNNTSDIENYPGYANISGPELAEKMFEPLENLGVEHLYGFVENIENHGDVKKVITDDEEFETRTVIVATGSKHRLLGVSGEEELNSRGVSYCAVCDGELTGRVVLRGRCNGAQIYNRSCGCQFTGMVAVKWGVTTSRSYLPKDNSRDFAGGESILDWLRQFASKEEDDNTFLRGFLGRMLFSGDEVNKSVNVLSGGEKVRVMLSKLMLLKSNVLVLDDPTNHLDLESISSLNDGLKNFKESIIFASHDHEFIQTLANHIIVLSKNGVIDRIDETYDEFLENEEVQAKVKELWSQS